MQLTFRALWAAVSVLMVALVSGCGQTPPAPSDVGGPSIVGSLRVEGPTSLSVGDVAVFRVIHEIGGETRDVTDIVHWRVAPPFLSITRGTATAIGVGSAQIRAELDGSGRPPLGSAPLGVQIASRIDGIYTLTIGGGVCRWSPLPREFTLRSYRASLVQWGTGLELKLLDGTFEGHVGGSAPVIVGGYGTGTEQVSFDLPAAERGWWNEYETVWAPITEVLPDGSRIEIYGTVRAAPVASGLSGTFKGTFAYWPSERAVFQLSRDCESDTNEFTLTR